MNRADHPPGAGHGGLRQGSSDRTSLESHVFSLKEPTKRKASTAELSDGAKRELAGAKDKSHSASAQTRYEKWNRRIFPTNPAVVHKMPESRKDGLPLRVPAELPPRGFYRAAREWMGRDSPFRTREQQARGLKSATDFVVKQGNRMRDEIYRFKRDKPRSLRTTRSVPSDMHAIFNIAPKKDAEHSGRASPPPSHGVRDASDRSMRFPRGPVPDASASADDPGSQSSRKRVSFKADLPPARTAEERAEGMPRKSASGNGRGSPAEAEEHGGAPPRSPRRGATDDERFPDGRTNPLHKGREMAHDDSPESESSSESPDHSHGSHRGGHVFGLGGGR